MFEKGHREWKMKTREDENNNPPTHRLAYKARASKSTFSTWDLPLKFEYIRGQGKLSV